jgi:hypothetical protein
LQTETKAASEVITDDMLRDTDDMLRDTWHAAWHRWHAAWHSWQLCGSFTASKRGRSFHTEHVFTWRLHAHKLSMKVNIRSCFIFFYTLQNY